MKILGVLLVGLFSGIFAAGSSLVSGAGIWAAVLNYLGVGLIFTLLATAFLIWRAWEAERPRAALVLQPAATGATK